MAALETTAQELALETLKQRLLMDRQDLSLNLLGTTAGTFHWSQAAKGRKIRRNSQGMMKPDARPAFFQ